MTMHKALLPRDDVGRRYVPRKKRRRGLDSIEESVEASIQRLKDNIQKRGGRLNTAIRNNNDNTWTNRTTITREKWEGKTTQWTF